MKKFVLGTVLVLAACQEPSADRSATPENALTTDRSRGRDVAEPGAPPAPGTVGGLPDDRTPLVEPQGAIDPKSAEAAGQVVQHYAALIEQGRWAEAAGDWGNAAGAADFARQFGERGEVHAEIGKPGAMEGAAGSVFVTVPVVFYGRLGDRQSFRRPGEAVLRRVNDVPGSTAAQRRWHIERISLTGSR